MLFILAASIVATITPTVNYQGRLTDDTGAPVPDGVYEIVFTIYNTESSSTPAWTSGTQSVTVSGGLFTYELGSNVPFPNKIFAYESRWLGIKVGSDSEILPRTEFQSVPYAYTAAKADTALVVANEDDFVHTTGDTMEGGLYFDGDGDGDYEGAFNVGSVTSSINLTSYDVETVNLNGGSYGQLELKHDDDGIDRVVLMAQYQGGQLLLADFGGAVNMSLIAGTPGDYSANFMSNAISNYEILDEPGIATDFLNTYTEVTSTIYMETITSITIDVPADGYVVIAANYFVQFLGSRDGKSVYVQLDDAEGGLVEAPNYQYTTIDSFLTAGYYTYPQSVERSFIVEEGEHTFYLESRIGAVGTGEVSIGRPRLIAKYFPTGYGTVKSLVSDAGEFDNSTPVQVVDEDGNTQTAYEVDLRELELKAKAKKIAAQKAYIEQLEAEQELARARQESE